MEEPWSKICITWIGLLKLAPCTEILSLTDGKFFLRFMKLYLNLDNECFTISQTFEAVGTTLRNEFLFHDLVSLSDAQQGHEEELVKVITLFMYLAVVKYEHTGPKNYLHDDAHFSEEAKFRIKCILEAVLEQHGVLNPTLLAEIIGSKISYTTGQLSAPVHKLRTTSRPSIGSPVIFTSSPGHESPLKEFLDSPTVRQVTKYQRLIEERNRHIRELRSQLENEKMEKQLIANELEQLREDKESADMEMITLKKEMKKRSSASDLNMSQNEGDSELSEKFHSLLKEKKDSDLYLVLVEKQQEEQNVENEQMRGRLEVLTTKLTAAQDEKRRMDVSFLEMQADLGSSKTENEYLQENIQNLRQQLDDLSQQLLIKSMPEKANTAMPMVSFHLESMDMANVSVDADDSCNLPTETTASTAGENMMEIVERKLEEEIESLGLELDAEREARDCEKKVAEARIASVEAEVKEKEQLVEDQRGEIVLIDERMGLVREKNMMLKEKVEIITGDVVVVSSTLKDIKFELEKVVQENDKMKVDLKNCQDAKLQLEDRFEVREKEISVLTIKLAGEKEVNGDLKRSVEGLKHSVEQKNQEIQSLAENLTTFSSKLENALEIEKSLAAIVEEKQKTIGQLVMEKVKMWEEKQLMKTELEEKLAKANSEINGLKVEILVKQSELTQNKLEELTAGFLMEKNELLIKLNQLNKEKLRRDQENLSKLQALQSALDDANNELTQEKKKYSDFEHSKADKDTKNALKAQKERYEKKHMEIIKGVVENNAKKMEGLKNMCIEKNISLEQTIEQLKREKKIALDKYVQSKQKANFLMEEVAKMETAFDICNRELGRAKAENSHLATLLSDAKLRERLSTVGSKTSLSSNGSSTSTAMSSKQSQAWKTCIEDQQEAAKTRERTSSTSSLCDDNPGPFKRQLPANKSNPGLQDRRSLVRRSLPSLPESDHEGTNDVFEMVSAAHTKADQTVSESKITSGVKMRPPSGSGSVFHCDEEEGEMFSPSYLTEKSQTSKAFSISNITGMKAGLGEVNDDGRMSELAKRNALCLPHLKSSYPIESQFLKDKNVTEDDIRQSKVNHPREENNESQSPMTNLSHKTDKLSLDSHCRKSHLGHQSHNHGHPGNSHRKCPSNLLQKYTSNPGSLSTSSDQPKPGRAKRQSGEESNDARIPSLPDKKATCIISPPKSTESEQLLSVKPKLPSLLSPCAIKNRKRKSEEREPEDPSQLDSSQDSQSSSFCRDNLYDNKRCKSEGEVYSCQWYFFGSEEVYSQKSSPPTPTRSHDRAPLLDTMNTPTSVQSRMTSLGIKQAFGSAFRKAEKVSARS